MRRWYVEGERPVLRSKPDLVATLLCEPDLSESDWQALKDNLSANDKDYAYSSFMNLQVIDLLYFGQNSLFGQRENEIYDFFLSDCIVVTAEHYEDHLTQTLPRQISQSLKYVSTITSNPYCQLWRDVEIFHRAVSLAPNRQFKFDRRTDTRELAQTLCSIEWGYRHPDKFDSASAPVVQKLYDIFTDQNINASLRDAYSATIEDQLEIYAEKTAAGGRVCACFRYASKAHCDAMIPMLTPSTRVPRTTDQPDGVALALPDSHGKELRISINLVLSLWRTGFSPVRYHQLDERTLYVEFVAPLMLDHARYALSTLRDDATNLKDRLKARVDEKEDLLFQGGVFADCVYYIESLVGSWMFGAMANEEGDVELLPGDDPRIDRIVESGEAAEHFLFKIMNEDHSRIMASGRACKF